ncbi:MAG TPA: hypothetical protein VF047_08350 [Nitrososphaeraceae archaeon]
MRYFLIGRRVYCVPFVDLDYEVVQERAKTNLRTLEQKKKGVQVMTIIIINLYQIFK